MKSIFSAFVLLSLLLTLPACKNDNAGTAANNPGASATDAQHPATTNNPPDPANAVNQPDNAPIKLDYLPDKLGMAKGCNCWLTDDSGAGQEKVLLMFSMTNPATVFINGHMQTMEEENPVNTAPNHRIIRVFKNDNFVVSANLNPKGKVTDEKVVNNYSGEITIYNLETKEMINKNVTGECGCR